MQKTLVLAALAGLAGAAQGQVVLNLGNLVVGDVPLQINLNGGAIPAGTYSSATLTTDWTAGPGIPFSNEGIWALTNGFDLGTSTFFVDPGAAPNSLGSQDPVSLAWNVNFDVNYNGGGTLIFNALQTFGGSSANWGNTILTLNEGGVVTPPPPINADLGTNPNGMTILPIAAGEVQWFEFDVTGGAGAQPWQIDTFGSTNTGGSFGDDDTEVGLYDSNGNLIATNDDFDFGGGILTSALSSAGVGNLADGTYYIAVGNFNTTFGPAFGVVSTSTAVGTNKLTVSFVPAPASIAVLGLGGLAVARRRR